jgi:two-component sensor histidine kinase/integral membrane sensor domain MASE1
LPTLRAKDLLPAPRDIPGLAALFIGYAVAVWAGLHWAVAPGGGSPIWPAAGIAFAGLVLGRPQLWPAVFLARLFVSIVTDAPQPWWANLLIAALAVATALGPALVIQHSGGLDRRLGSLRDMARLILLGGLGGAAVAIGSAVVVTGTDGAGVPLPVVAENWAFGVFTGVLVVAPVMITLARREAWRIRPSELAHFAVCMAALALVAGHVFIQPDVPPLGSWQVFPFLVWAALAFNVQGAAAGLLIVTAISTLCAIEGLWPQSTAAMDAARRMLTAQQFVAATSLTILVLAAVADERRGQARLAQSEKRLRAETEALEILNTTGAHIAAELDLDRLVQSVTDAGVALSGARFGAFFYNVVGADGETYRLYALSGAPRAAFENFPMPRNTAVFAPTFEGQGMVRSDDITRDPRYGHSAPHYGQPKGHLPVRSYLAAPVKSRSGEVIGGLFFGHPETGIFDARTERLIEGLASQAAIAIDNARLYQGAQREIAERTRAEEHQRLLINELNHRVKNTLATVQSLASQIRRGAQDPRASYEAFTARLMALSRAHDVLTRQRWEGADLKEIAAGAVQPFDLDGGRFMLKGASVWLEPQTALALAMAWHELATNAAKYGALSVNSGKVDLSWSVMPDSDDALALELVWRESGGPEVKRPTRKGFGSRLLERGLAAELNGEVTVDYQPSGLVCRMTARVPRADATMAAAE